MRIINTRTKAMAGINEITGSHVGGYEDTHEPRLSNMEKFQCHLHIRMVALVTGDAAVGVEGELVEDFKNDIVQLAKHAPVLSSFQRLQYEGE